MLYPRLVPGGVMIVDDYGHWRGARKAVDEYFRDAHPLLIRTITPARLPLKRRPGACGGVALAFPLC